ncbi:MAG: DUF4926 domain-containing protein [Acidobacteria bacterium]|nr:DUF4926 domain-containing protein [Acidobacteriota bacterium]
MADAGGRPPDPASESGRRTGRAHAVRPAVHDSSYPERTERRIGSCGEYLVRSGTRRGAALRDRISRRRPVTLHPLDVVVLVHDLPTHGLRSGDLGAVVEVYGPDAIGVEFVAASGRTQALVTLQPRDLRHAGDNDLVAVRPSASSTNRSDV